MMWQEAYRQANKRLLWGAVRFILPPDGYESNEKRLTILIYKKVMKIRMIIQCTAFLVWALGCMFSLSAQSIANSQQLRLNTLSGSDAIVRSYNSIVDVVCVYGHPSNMISLTGANLDRSIFLIHDYQNSEVVYIDTLPEGYVVNDMQFVGLKRKNSPVVDTLCCFCGTRTTVDGEGYWTVVPEGETSQYVVPTTTYGFVGFFLMGAALNPMGIDSIYYRDIERSLSLDKMVAYPEFRGAYCPNAAYDHNAVIDVIGLSDTAGLACFDRVKFYLPVQGSGSGVFWDNNMRLPNNADEVPVDIIQTSTRVVTVSILNGIDSLLWIRSNNKENYWYSGGMELSDTYYPIDMTHINFPFSAIPNQTKYLPPVKLCAMDGDCFSLSLGSRCSMDGFDYVNGLISFKFNAMSPSASLEGIYDKIHCELVDVSYLPISNSIATLYRDNDYRDYRVQVTSWEHGSYQYQYPGGYYLMSDRKGLSMDTRKLNNREYLHLVNRCNQSPYRISLDHQMHQQASIRCFDYFQLNLDPVSISRIIPQESSFGIVDRFQDDPIHFPSCSLPIRHETLNVSSTCKKTGTSSNVSTREEE